MTMTNRTFGVEIECIGINASQALAAMQQAGVQVEIEHYNHNTRSHWKITTDSSVRDNSGGFGIEVVSPVLSGTAGLNEARKVATALSDAGATANKTCGLHVHVGADDLSIDDIKMIVKRYTMFENDIDGFMPQSRRASNNIYIRSMSSFAAAEAHKLAACATASSLRNTCFERYYKVNLASYVRQGTIEFRQHSGTVNADKITNWVLFVLNFVEMSRLTAIAPVRRGRGRPAGRSNARDKGLFKIVKAIYNDMGYNMTVERLADISGYAVNSIPACISEIRRKWNIRIRKCRATNAYVSGISYARLCEIEQTLNNVAERPTTVMVAFSGVDSALRGLPANVVSYFNERAMELAA